MFYQFISAFLGRLKLPWLFVASVTGLLLNLVFPDPIPFLDEVLMALVAALLASIRKPRHRADDKSS